MTILSNGAPWCTNILHHSYAPTFLNVHPAQNTNISRHPARHVELVGITEVDAGLLASVDCHCPRYGTRYHSDQVGLARSRKKDMTRQWPALIALAVS